MNWISPRTTQLLSLLVLNGLSLIGCDATIGSYGPAVDANNSPVIDANNSPVIDADQPATDAPIAPVADAAPAIDANEPPPCIEGEVRVQDPDTGHCYMLFTTSVQQNVANQMCGDLNGYLVTITSEQENSLISSLDNTLDLWIGGTDTATEGTFGWITTEPFVYTNWREGEPNDFEGREDCMIIQTDLQGVWDDRDCTNSYGYLCERE